LRDWIDLHREVNRLDLTGRQKNAERDRFEEWCVLAEEQVLVALAARAESRAQELERETGAYIRVSTSGAVPVATATGPVSRPRFRMVSLELGACRVDVYSARAVYESPCFHLGVLQGRTASVRFPVMASIPGCLVVRLEDDGFELLVPPPLEITLDFPASPPVAASGRAPERRTTSMDAVLLRAFELLVGAHQSTRAA
jgi:hypothetical protein